MQSLIDWTHHEDNLTVAIHVLLWHSSRLLVLMALECTLLQISSRCEHQCNTYNIKCICHVLYPRAQGKLYTCTDLGFHVGLCIAYSLLNFVVLILRTFFDVRQLLFEIFDRIIALARVNSTRDLAHFVEDLCFCFGASSRCTFLEYILRILHFLPLQQTPHTCWVLP